MIYSFPIKRYAPILIFVSSLILYGLSAGIKLREQSKTPQYVFLAYSFLHGHTDLITLPKSKFDLISYDNKWYVAGGVTPALLLMPFVAMFGTDVSDVLFGVVTGAMNVTLMYLLMGQLNKNTKVHLWLTSLFAVGTVHWWVSSVGSVWFNAQLVALLFMILSVRSSLSGRPWLAGLFLSLAALSRPPTLFSALFHVLIIVQNEKTTRRILAKLIPFGIAMSVGISLLLAYNYLRFGSPFEFGYGNVQGTPALTNAYSTRGGFNISYMSCNIYVSLLGLPNIAWNPLPSVNQFCPHLQPTDRTFKDLSTFFNPLGMSIFLSSPAFLLIFRAGRKEKVVIPSWAGMMGTVIVLWMYHTTGYVQFGYRYLLDVAVFIFLLLATAIHKIGILENILLSISIAMGATGLYLMYYMTFGLIWTEMFIDTLKKIYWIIF